MTRFSDLRVITVAFLLSFGAIQIQPVSAQRAEGGLGVAFAGGPTLNDLETGGVDWIFAAGGEWRPSTGWLVVQADVRYLTYMLARRETLVMPEIDVQIEAVLGPVVPFLGAGLGFQYAARHGDDASSFSYNLTAGMRFRLANRLAIRLEARGRSVDPFIGLTAGMVWQL